MELWCHFTCHRIPPSPCIVPASLKDLHQIYVNISNCEMKSKLPQFSYNVKWTLDTWTVWQLISPGCSFFGLHSSFSSFWILQSPVKKGKHVSCPNSSPLPLDNFFLDTDQCSRRWERLKIYFFPVFQNFRLLCFKKWNLLSPSTLLFSAASACNLLLSACDQADISRSDYMMISWSLIRSGEGELRLDQIADCALSWCDQTNCA